MRAKLFLCAAGIVLLGVCTTAVSLSSQALSAQETAQADGKGNRPRMAEPRAVAGLADPGNGINSHGGPVMLGAVRMYYIWYGTWDTASKSVLTNFANGIGGSPYFNINTGYSDGSSASVSNSVSYGGSAADNYSLGKSLSDANVGTIVSNVLASGSLPTDPNGVYFVLTSSDVTETSGFTTSYCAWHTSGSLNGSNIKYSFIGDASKINPEACSAQSTVSPNGNPAMDAIVSLIGGELNESVTDPNLNGWFDSTGAENADKCAWTFGSTYTLPNGSVANMNLGGYDFLIQQNWVNAAGGYCASSWSPRPESASGGSVARHAMSANAVVNTAGVSGSLSGSGNSNTTAANLTTEGTADWVHWGDASLTRKTGGGTQVSTYAVVGGAAVQTYTNDLRPLSWTDGTPTASSTNNLKGVYVSGTGKGFSITAPADTTIRTLIVHVGGWNSGGTLTAHLSDTSAGDFTNTTAIVTGQYDRNYTLIYQAGNAAQSLTVTWKMASGTGNVTLNGAALSGPPPIVPSISATGGLSQSATIGTAFGSSLQATVKDASNNPIAGATVTFAAPGSGASGTFGGSATVTTDVNGLATSPAFTANNIAGHYNVVASTPGAASTASFGLTNLTGSPASITASGGALQGAAINAAFGTLLVATVKDLGGNPVSGATVTFTAPSTGASGTFTGNLAAVDVVTIANGTATAPPFTANGLSGSYAVVASVGTVSPSASFNLTNNPPVVGGALSGNGDSNTAAANLTTEGTSDWLHLGDASLTRKTGGGTQLSYAVVGGVASSMYSNDPRLLSWTDGTPTATGASNAKGIFVSGTGKGFSITAPADTTVRTLIVHVGGWNSGGTLTAHLSDTSANDFTNTTSIVPGQYDRNYVLIYHAGAPGQNLTVTWKMASGTGNVTFSGTALSGPPPLIPSISATGGALQSATIGTAFASSLQVLVRDASSNPINGAPVTFAAPGSGASGTFSGPVTVNTDVTGVAIAPPFTANGIAGHYTVVAITPGAVPSASFSLTNLAGPPASITATSGTPQSAIFNTAFGNPLVATVRDLGGNLISGAAVTFTAPGSGASAAFGSGLTATALTDLNGVATAPTLTANGTAGTYSVTAGVSGVLSTASFTLTNNLAGPITLVQHNTVNSGISLPSVTVAFPTANKLGNWIGVAIYGGEGTAHQFTVTDTNGNIYRHALTQGNTIGNATMGIYYAENIKPGANTVKVVPDAAGYLRVVILEYSGLATSNSLDVTASTQYTGSSTTSNFTPDSGTVTTTSDGDLLLGIEICGDANSIVAGPGYRAVDLVPLLGTKLIVEDQIQTVAGPASATTVSQNNWGWAMAMVSFKKAQ